MKAAFTQIKEQMMHVQNFIQCSFDCFGIFILGNKSEVDHHSQETTGFPVLSAGELCYGQQLKKLSQEVGLIWGNETS